MAKLTNKQIAQALFEATEKLSGADLDGALQRFVDLLAKKQKLKQIGNIIAEFESISKKAEGIVGIEIKSAKKLDSTTMDGIKKVFGDKVEASEEVDEELLGGITVKTEDKILDGSLKTQLNKLKLKLSN
ncbi:MAG: ATP synthase F1 subunit delta [Candidatus Magasanikbacteria bacterium]|jgi:F-type H+-transporting ATPase subunit delta|nr:ATP synthase F1 subunit delta [Candidatus Magasanikbacteria bacterium]MBT4315296.1 ATP synthase F1 subunit delta [Candidatus Magasanikbacteria bacterium]MBT4547168.1 ATP synthase F1 subunit delta [Candidatus Magasanikbacteria bacterium]MBT6819692.1 ATP synthase F1 subunit delta [Candidatus Magasanikbacteria bacterium]